MRRRYSFDEIMKMDNDLLQLAVYESSGGHVFVPKSQEDLLAFHVKNAEIFNQFKDMIRSGETTLEELKIQVGNRWGAVEQNNTNETTPDNIDAIIKEIDEENTLRENRPVGLERLLSAMLGDIGGSLAIIPPDGKDNPFSISAQKGDIVQKDGYNDKDEKQVKRRKPRTKKSGPNP